VVHFLNSDEITQFPTSIALKSSLSMV
jgi:hypothetical protein